jgi:2-dehydropantoate 2-reductase
MKILVVGAGATGGYFGARLAQAQRDVTFLLRPRRASQIREGGIRLTGQGSDETVTARVVTAEQMEDRYDVILLTVRNQALMSALDDIAPAVGPDTLIVPFQNGLWHLDRLNERFGGAEVLGGAVRVATTLDEDGAIVQLAPMASLIIGPQPGSQPTSMAQVGETLTVPGYELAVSEHILTDMWVKWAFIATADALTCLMRGTVGEIAAVPGGREAALSLIDETARTAAASGFPLPATQIDAMTSMLTEAGSQFVPSMYRDVAAGLPTEVEYILADLVERAELHGVETPTLGLATTQLRVYEERRAARSGSA